MPQCKSCRKLYDQSEKGKASRRSYKQSEKGKAANKRYKQNEKGKASTKRYDQSKKRKAARKRYKKSEKGKVTEKRYRQSDKGKAVHRTVIKRFNTRHPNQEKATHAVNHAIAAGKLPRPDTLLCHYCGEQAKHYHHHKGYAPNNWLKVIPVCIKCHKKIA